VIILFEQQLNSGMYCSFCCTIQLLFLSYVSSEKADVDTTFCRTDTVINTL